ncbi:MAG: AAA family ATPase [bacterium]
MLTSITIENFKQFEKIEIELGDSVLLIGPNNSGKTTALQALTLWNIGVRQWLAKRQGKGVAEKRSGVTINRKDLIAIPMPDANLLWRNLRIRATAETGNGTQNIRIAITVKGITGGKEWQCGLEFDYANEESFYCRPLRTDKSGDMRMPVPDETGQTRIAFLPPMSGLAAIETKLESGRIDVLIGEGQTAQVLRNLCYQISSAAPDDWSKITGNIERLFGIIIKEPKYDAVRSEITMVYANRDQSKTLLDLSTTGRGVQQTLLLLTHLYTHPHTVLLLDEPDAHLEILRQRQIYQLLTETAEKLGSQVIIASHSEVVLEEAAGRDIVIAFVGKPHRIDDRGSQVMKSLKEIGYDQYYQAEQKGWVLYLEGSTDLAILKAWAEILNHPAKEQLEDAFVHYIGNVMAKARDHFYGLREAKSDLRGIAILDRDEKDQPQTGVLRELRWRRREIENYLVSERVLLAFARGRDSSSDIFAASDAVVNEAKMHAAIAKISEALEELNKDSPWSVDTKTTDDFLDPLFKRYYADIGLPLLTRKSDYHELARYMDVADIDPEIIEKLDAIVAVATGNG